MPRQWSDENLKYFEDSAAARRERFKALWSALPPPARWAPADWAPKSPAGKAQYALGYERLATEPIFFAFDWDVKSRVADSELSMATPLNVELLAWADEQPPRLLMAPASALWRFSSKERWRSFCAQAAGLSEERLRRALIESAGFLGKGFHDALPLSWASKTGRWHLSSQDECEKTHSGGFMTAFGVSLNPGRLLDERSPGMDEASGEGWLEQARGRLDASLDSASARLSEELSCGWAASLDAWTGSSAKRPFPYSWDEVSEQRHEAARLCHSAWEAGEIERGLGPSAPPASKAPRSRL